MNLKPFRWNFAKREQLGGLLSKAPFVDLHKNSFLKTLRTTTARILALTDNADLAFLGRTPENIFDYLSGVFHGVDDAPRLHLVHFSLRWAGANGVGSINPDQRNAFFNYLLEEGISPKLITEGKRPLALVDFVAYGGTMKNFVALLHHQAKRDGIDWNAVQRKLRIIGLRTQTRNSPNTWRWEQHQDWLDLIPDTEVKNVSAPAHFLFELANDQPKTTAAFHPGRWGDISIKSPSDLSAAQLEAIAMAASLFDKGSMREERLLLAARISEKPQMRQASTRSLVLKLKGL